MTRQNRKGFTLIEILIVVIILGILAAIVIPQFTNASKEAKQSALVTMVQSLRSQIALYKLQHNDYLPGSPVTAGAQAGFVSGEPVAPATDPTANSFWAQMTLFSDVNGNTAAAKSTTFAYGPYMQSIAVNPLVTSTTASTIKTGTANATGCGFVYDYGTNGDGSGKLWGVD